MKFNDYKWVPSAFFGWKYPLPTNSLFPQSQYPCSLCADPLFLPLSVNTRSPSTSAHAPPSNLPTCHSFGRARQGSSNQWRLPLPITGRTSVSASLIPRTRRSVIEISRVSSFYFYFFGILTRIFRFFSRYLRHLGLISQAHGKCLRLLEFSEIRVVDVGFFFS